MMNNDFLVFSKLSIQKCFLKSFQKNSWFSFGKNLKFCSFFILCVLPCWLQLAGVMQIACWENPGQVILKLNLFLFRYFFLFYKYKQPVGRGQVILKLNLLLFLFLSFCLFVFFLVLQIACWGNQKARPAGESYFKLKSVALVSFCLFSNANTHLGEPEGQEKVKSLGRKLNLTKISFQVSFLG